MYQRLADAKREIRLLILGPGIPTDVVDCRLVTVSLKDNPAFEVRCSAQRLSAQNGRDASDLL
jgi:hypothetical protein